MPNLNILVIGAGMYVCGRGTQTYGTIMPALCEWKRSNDSGEVYICGRSLRSVENARAKIEELKMRMGVKFPIKYLPEAEDNPKCYEEAVRKIPRPACVIVAVPDNLHKEAVLAALKEGLHTLVVKPLVPTVKDALELIELQNKKRVYCAVEFHKRLDHANLQLKDTIEQGLIGEPLYFLVEYSQRKSMPTQIFKDWIKWTNVFQYLGIHYVDIIYFVTKAIPKRVMANGQKNWLHSNGIDAFDSIESVIDWQMPSGRSFSSHILNNWIDPESTSAMSDQRIKLIGTKGRFESDQKKRGITTVRDESGIEEPNPYFCCGYGQHGNIRYYGYGVDSVNQFLKDVVQIEEGALKIDDLEDKRPTFKESIVTTKVLEAVNASLRDGGRWVDI